MVAVRRSAAVRVYLSAIPDIASEDVDELLARTGVDADAVVSRLPAGERSRLADALEAAAARAPR